MGHTKRSRNAGFTAVEIAVSMVVIGLTLAATLPAFGRFITSNSLQNGAEQMAANLRLARQMAVSDGDDRLFIWDASKWAYVIVRDENGDGQVQSGEEKAGPYSLPEHVEWKSPAQGTNISSGMITFSPDGSASTSGSVMFENSRGNQVTLTLLGPTGQVVLE